MARARHLLAQFGRVTAAEIGAHIGRLHKTKVSRAVTALVAAISWVRRDDHKDDGRIQSLSLTRSGERAYAELALGPCWRWRARCYSRSIKREVAALFTALHSLEKMLYEGKTR